MNGRIGVVHAFMIAFVNKALDDGFKIPVPTGLTGHLFTHPRIRMFEKYLFIDAQPDKKSFAGKKHALV